jgi:hypothetical protein
MQARMHGTRFCRVGFADQRSPPQTADDVSKADESELETSPNVAAALSFAGDINSAY